MKDFPLLARVCVRPGLDMLALREAGYNSTDSYFTGKSRFNSSVIGWAGHTKDGKVKLDSIEGLFEGLKQNVSLSAHLDSIIVTTIHEQKVTLKTYLIFVTSISYM